MRSRRSPPRRSRVADRADQRPPARSPTRDAARRSRHERTRLERTAGPRLAPSARSRATPDRAAMGHDDRRPAPPRCELRPRRRDARGQGAGWVAAGPRRCRSRPAASCAARSATAPSISSNVSPSAPPTSTSCQRSSIVEPVRRSPGRSPSRVSSARRRGLETIRVTPGSISAARRRPRHLASPAAGVVQRRVGEAAVADAGPVGRGMTDEDDHDGRVVVARDLRDTPADSNVAISSRIRHAADSSPIASAAPVPSPSRRSSSRTGRSPRRSSATAWPGSTERCGGEQPRSDRRREARRDECRRAGDEAVEHDRHARGSGLHATPTSAAISSPPTAARTPIGSSGSGALTASARSIMATFRRQASSSMPVPRPVTSATGAPVRTAVIALTRPSCCRSPSRRGR